MKKPIQVGLSCLGILVVILIIINQTNFLQILNPEDIASVYEDNISISEKSEEQDNFKKAMFTLIDDDGLSGVKTKLKPILDRYSYKAGIAVVSSSIGAEGYLTHDELKKLQDEGYEILSHSITHRKNHLLNEEEQKVELIESAQTLKGYGYNINGFVYPYSSQNEMTRKIASIQYKYSFGGWGINDVSLDPMYINRVTLGEDENLTINNFKSYVNQAVDNNWWLVLCTHIDATSEEQIQVLSELIDYISTVDIEVVTPAEGFEYFGDKR